MSNVIQVDHVYKQYQAVGTMRIRTIVQDLARTFRASARAAKASPESHYVLNDISFGLEQGQALGVIGHNGSGKTTLLRLLAGVSLPTKGSLSVKGNVAPLLALGAGFHPDLTGHENLFLNCTLMGLSRKQSLDRIEQIIDFADIGEYIDTPIKRYSSGMLARLGFSAAMHLDPEIILLDEVLAVGDYNFSVKANAVIREFVGKGTLVLISHDLSSVEKLCSRVIWLDHGKMRADGNSSEVIAEYTRSEQARMIAQAKPAAPAAAQPQEEKKLIEGTDGSVKINKNIYDQRVDINGVTLHDKNGQIQNQFQFGEDILVRCHLHLKEAVPNCRVVLGIIDIESHAVITACDNQQLPESGEWSGDVVLEGLFPAMKLRPRELGVWVGISNPIALMPLATWRDITPRFFSIGARRDAEHHYYAPQGDLIYTPNVKMRRIATK